MNGGRVRLSAGKKRIGTGLHNNRQAQNCFMFLCRETNQKKNNQWIAFIYGNPSIDSDSLSTCYNRLNNSSAPGYDIV